MGRKIPREVALAGAGLDASRLLLVVLDAEGRILRVNRSIEVATGSSRTELRGKRLWDLVGLAPERASVREACGHLAEGRFPSEIFFHLVGAAGALRVVDWSSVVVHPDGGAPPVAVCVGLELSERQETTEVLRKTEARQRLLLERLPAVVWSTDRELRFTSSEGGALVQLGLKRDLVAMLGTSIYSYLNTNDPLHPTIAAHHRALEGEGANFETNWLGRAFQARVEPLVDQDGNTIGTVGVALDITERQQMERSLTESEGRLRRIVDANVIGIQFWDGYRVLDANRSFRELLGITEDEIASGRISWRELTPPEYALADDRAMRELQEKGTFTPFEKEYLRKDGTRVPVLLGGANFEGRKDQGIAFVLDLSEEVRLRKLRDELLEREKDARLEANRARERFQLLAEASKVLTRSLDLGRTLENLARFLATTLADWCYVVYRGWNGSSALVATAHVDPAREDLLRTLRSCQPEAGAPEGAARAFRTGKLGVYSDVSEDQLWSDGERWPLVGTRDPRHLATIRELGMRSLLCVPVVGTHGVDAVMVLVSSQNPRRFGPDEVALAHEIANRAAVAIENARLFADALDAVRARDEFLAVAAHELRTPITSALLYVETMRRLVEGLEAPASSRAASVVQSSERQLRKLSSLMDQLLDVSRIATQKLVLRVEEVDFAQLVRDVLASLCADPQRARCVAGFSTPARVVGRWDAMRLEQVTTNLIGNALKFGPGRPIEVMLEALPSGARLSVRDHGIGISREDQPRIFERFERAVPHTHFGGMGLGLYVTGQIVRALGGSIRVESEPGQGALFVVELPWESAPA